MQLFLLIIFLCGGAAAVEESPVTPQKAVTAETASKINVLFVSDLFEPNAQEALNRTIASQSGDLNADIHFLHVDALPLNTTEQQQTIETLMSTHHAQMAFMVRSNSDNSAIMLYIFEKSDQTITSTMRRIDISEGTPLNEALAVIVRSGISAGTNNVKKTAAPPPAKPKKPKPRPSVPPQKSQPPNLQKFFGDIGLAVGWYSRQTTPWFGMRVGLGGYPIENLYLDIQYTAFAKINAESSPISLTLMPHPIAFGAGYVVQRPWLTVGGSLSFCLNYVKNKVVSKEDRFLIGSDKDDLHIDLVGTLHAAIRIKDPIYLFIRAGILVPLKNKRYRIATNNGDRIVLRPLRVQPTSSIGLRVHFF